MGLPVNPKVLNWRCKVLSRVSTWSGARSIHLVRRVLMTAVRTMRRTNATGGGRLQKGGGAPLAYYGYLALSCNSTTTQEDAPRRMIYWARENISVMAWVGNVGRESA